MNLNYYDINNTEIRFLPMSKKDEFEHMKRL